MKKIICLLLCSCLLFSYSAAVPNYSYAYGSVSYEDYSEPKSKYRILYGILLILGGGFLTYDGFRTVKTDISNPNVTMEFASTRSQGAFGGGPAYIVNSTGTIVNTGNVALNNVRVQITYNNTQGNAVSSLGTPIVYNSNGGYSINLDMNQAEVWTNRQGYTSTEASNNPWPGSGFGPFYGTYPSASGETLIRVLDITYDYSKKYKEEMNSVYEGIAGVLLLGGGIYLIVDYIISLRRFDYYMKKNSMNMYVEHAPDEFKLMLSKKL